MNIKNPKYVLTFVYLIFILFTYAQTKDAGKFNKLMVESNIHYGFLIPHHVEMQIFNAHFPVFEISVLKATYGNTRWEYMYNYPLIGITFWHSSMGNSEYFGSATAIYPYINFPLGKSKDNNINFKLGFGLGYIEKPFDRIENHKNIAIGSHINAAVSFYFNYRKKLNRKFIFSTGIGFMHMSNGATKTPNYGINIPTVNIGMAYRLGKENPYNKNKLLPELYPFEFDGKQYLYLNANGGIGIKSLNSEYGRTYFVYTLTSNIYKQISYKSRIGVGLEMIYDGSDYFSLIRNKTEINNKFEVVRPGFHLSYEVIVSKVSLVLNLGSYFGGKEKSDGNIYEKIGLKYKIDNNWFSHITLKAHAGRADYLTFGFGRQINIRYYR